MGGKQNLHADGLGQHPGAVLAVLGSSFYEEGAASEGGTVELPAAVFMIAARGRVDPFEREHILLPCFPRMLIVLNGNLAIGKSHHGEGVVHGKLPVTHSAKQGAHIVLACKKFKRVEGRPEHAAAEGVLVQNFDPRCPLDCSFYRMAIKGSVCKTDSPLAYRSLVERTPQALYDPHPESITWDPGLLIGSVAYLEGLGLVPNMNYGRCVHVCEGAVICLCLVEHRGDELTQTSADKLLIKFPLYQEWHNKTKYNLHACWVAARERNTTVRVFYNKKHPHFPVVMTRHPYLESRQGSEVSKFPWIYAANMCVNKIEGGAVFLSE